MRKFRAGNSGRFSTDLDFAVPDAETGEMLLDLLDGAETFGLRFRLTNRDGPRGRLEVETPLGRPEVPARIEVTARPLWLTCERVVPVALPVHDGYEFALPALPVPAVEEAIAEKLAAWRRRRKMRDLYDLFWFGQGTLDEALVRRILVLKVWHDVAEEGLGRGPFDPTEIVEPFDARRLPPEEIGLLTQPVEPERWLATVRQRYRFVTELDDLERQLASCDPRDRHTVARAAAAIEGRKTTTRTRSQPFQVEAHRDRDRCCRGRRAHQRWTGRSDCDGRLCHRYRPHGRRSGPHRRFQDESASRVLASALEGHRFHHRERFR